MYDTPKIHAANLHSIKMKYIGSIYLVLFFTLTTQIAWGQTPDPAKPSSTTDTVGYKTVTSDRINEADDRERGPSLAKMLKMADESFAKKNYFQAMVYYRNVVKAEPFYRSISQTRLFNVW